MQRLVVVGADAAGMSAAAQARRRRPQEDLSIVAFEMGQFTSYSACGIPYWISGTVATRDELIARSPAEHRRRGIDVRLGHEVIAIDVAAQRVTVRDRDSGRELREGFDQLMIATGATPVRPPLPGIDAHGVHGVQTLGDAQRLLDSLTASGARRAVVVGSGYIGLEVAEAMVQRGLEVTIVERGPQPMATLDPDMGALVADAIRGLGITLHTATAVEGFDVDAKAHVREVITATGTRLPADVVLLGMGVRPNVGLARDAGIVIGASGGIAVDQRSHTTTPEVYSGGDCAEKFHLVSRQPVAIALGTHANKQGRVAGINLGGGHATFRGVVGTAAAKICAYEVARTGLTEAEAAAAGLSYTTQTVRSSSRAGYYPGAEMMTVKVVVEQHSARLLGAQIVGRQEAAKRIDVFATALWNQMTVEDLIDVDLSYAPPFAPLWDPVLIAARKAWEQLP